MTKKYKTLSSNVRRNTHEFLVDTAEDLIKLPKEPGSFSLVAESGDIYVCNNVGEWKNITGEDTTPQETEEPTQPDNNFTLAFGEPQYGPRLGSRAPDISNSFVSNYVGMPLKGIYTDSTKEKMLFDIVSSYYPIQDVSKNVSCSINQIGYSYSDPESLVNLPYNEELYFICNTVPAGTYVESIPISGLSNNETFNGYICTILNDPVEGSVFTAITPWDGEIDVIKDSQDNIILGFTVPNIGGVPDHSTNVMFEYNTLILVPNSER